MTIIRNLSRILIGLVFIFSGFVKGVDPLGTAYRIQDYFTAFHMPWASPLSVFLSIFLCTLEFSIGISMLFNLRIRFTSWILLPVMLFFTVLTFFDYLYSPVPDCGCFGDAIKLTNGQTFLKNLVLMVFVIPVFAGRNKFRNPVGGTFENILLVAFAAGFTWMSVHCYRHLPLIDFMGWKKGNTINKDKPAPLSYYLTYRNKVTGEEKEYLSPDYPWNDSVWMAQWEFKSQRVVDPNPSGLLTLRIEDLQGNDFTRAILDNPDYHFLLVSYDLRTADKAAFIRMEPFFKRAEEKGLSFLCITSSLIQDIDSFRKESGTTFEYCNADDVVLKTMVRSNPGLILLKNGVVIEKWAFRDFPDFDEVNKILIKK